MQFATYAAFREALLTLLDGDDVSQSDLSVATLDLIIGAGEVRIYRDVRSSTQDTALSLTVTNNAAALPANFLELKGSPFISGFRSAIYTPWENLQNNIQTGSSTAARSYQYSFEGDTMVFYPALNGSTVTGRYYKKFNDISTGTNALFDRHPDLFIYASLAESAPFLGEMSRLSVWDQKYSSLVQTANEHERRRVTRGSKFQTRVG